MRQLSPSSVSLQNQSELIRRGYIVPIRWPPFSVFSGTKVKNFPYSSGQQPCVILGKLLNLCRLQFSYLHNVTMQTTAPAPTGLLWGLQDEIVKHSEQCWHTHVSYHIIMRMSLAGRSKDNKHKLSWENIFEVQQVKNRNGMGSDTKKALIINI